MLVSYFFPSLIYAAVYGELEVDKSLFGEGRLGRSMPYAWILFRMNNWFLVNYIVCQNTSTICNVWKTGWTIFYFQICAVKCGELTSLKAGYKTLRVIDKPSTGQQVPETQDRVAFSLSQKPQGFHLFWNISYYPSQKHCFMVAAAEKVRVLPAEM